MSGRHRPLRTANAAAWVAALVAAAWPGGAGAQAGSSQAGMSQAGVSLDAGVAGIRYADTVSVTAVSVGPTFRHETATMSLEASGTHSRLTSADGRSSWASQGAVAASLFSPSLVTLAGAALRGELAASGGMSAHGDDTRTGQWSGAARLHLMDARRGAWAGGGAGRTWDGLVWRATRGAEAGAWTRAGNTMLAVVARPTWVAPDEGARIRHTDFELAARWAAGRVELGAVLGARAGDTGEAAAGDERAWGSGSLTVHLGERLALVAGAGAYPVDFTQGFPGGRFASLALRVAPWRSAWRGSGAPPTTGAAAERPGVATHFHAAAAARGLHRLRVRVPGAARVEVAGSFTSWAPVALRAEGDGWWGAELPLSAGSHEIALRVDGGPWAPPPGLVVVSDELGGAVGILVIP